MRRGSVIVVLALTACSGTSSPGMDGSVPVDAASVDAPIDAPPDASCRPVPHGSCNETSRCYDFVGRFWASGDPRDSCTMGTYDETCGCPSAGAIGSCHIFEGLLNEQEVWYYEGDAAALEAQCASDDGTWTPGPATPMDAGAMDAGSDAGMDAGPADAGPPACAPGTVTFMDSCPFVGCGGGLDGRFCYDQVCLTPRELIGSSFFSLLCTVPIPRRNASGSVQGEIAFDGAASTYSRDVTLTFGVTLELPDGVCSSNGMCSQVQNGANAVLMPHGTATCTNRTPTGCDCTIAYARTIESSGGFSTTGTTANIGGQTYGYCLMPSGDAGSSAGLVFQSADNPRTEPGLSLVSR